MDEGEQRDGLMLAREIGIKPLIVEVDIGFFFYLIASYTDIYL